jgi:hypothetical protein
MITDNIIASLSDEERELLLKLYTKIAENEHKRHNSDDDIYFEPTEKTPSQEEILQQIEHDSIHQYDEIKNGEAIMDTPVELIFNVNGVVFEKNTLGEIIRQSDLFVKSYHVPLVNHNQIKEYIEKFFQKFASTLEATAKEVIE